MKLLGERDGHGLDQGSRKIERRDKVKCWGGKGRSPWRLVSFSETWKETHACPKLPNKTCEDLYGELYVSMCWDT